jgi:hypothetical protein
VETKNGKELETEAMEMFHSLIPETQGMVASHIRMAYMVEQAIRKEYGLPEEPVGKPA